MTTSGSLRRTPHSSWWANKWLWAIVLGGLGLRLLFVAVGAKAYYGSGNEFFNGDSESYIMSFRNLYEQGTYTFDFKEPDAAFGRLPGYPLFYGLHYLLLGPDKAVLGVACSQAMLDSLAIVLVFLIVGRLSVREPGLSGAAHLAAFVYACYPFVIVWTTVIGTEVLATFFVLLWLHTLLLPNKGPGHYLLLGVELAYVFYVREFIGILLPITCIYLFWCQGDSKLKAFRNCALVGAAFAVLYIGWPIRNYVFQHRVMLVKPARAGYANYKADMVSFLDWVHSWSNESTYWLQQVLTNPKPAFPSTAFASPQEQQQAQVLVDKAVTCGSSFRLYLHQPLKAGEAACDEEVSQGFENLRQSFKQRNPLTYYTRVPLQNLYKVFFKSGTQERSGITKKNFLLTVVFGYRTVLVLLGLAGLVVFRRQPGLKPILMYWVFIIVFICWQFRQLEMRYILQADVLLLVPAVMLLSKWLLPYFSRIKAQRSATPLSSE